MTPTTPIPTCPPGYAQYGKLFIRQGIYRIEYPEQMKRKGSTDHRAYAVGILDTSYGIYSAVEETEYGPLRHASISKMVLGEPVPLLKKNIDRLRREVPEAAIPDDPCSYEPFNIRSEPFYMKGMHVWQTPTTTPSPPSSSPSVSPSS